MIRAWFLARVYHVGELFGFERVLECPHCGRWFPMWGPSGLFVHLMGGTE